MGRARGSGGGGEKGGEERMRNKGGAGGARDWRGSNGKIVLGMRRRRNRRGDECEDDNREALEPKATHVHARTGEDAVGYQD